MDATEHDKPNSKSVLHIAYMLHINCYKGSNNISHNPIKAILHYMM